MPRTNAVLKGTKSRCQCVVCGEFFSTTRNFDKHRKGDHDNRYCVDPEDVGLVIGESHGNTFWKEEGSNGTAGRVEVSLSGAVTTMMSRESI
jgi:hypothetical protein